MDHIRILRRALDITRVYRALWIFGVLLALTTSSSGSGGGGGGGRGGVNYQFDRNTPPFNDLPWLRNFQMPAINWGQIAGIVVALICVVLVLAVIFTILRYVASTALIRMVDGYEATGEKVTVRQGFRLGWSNRSFRNWLARLLIFLAGFVAVILLLLIAAAPLLLWLTRDNTLGVIGTVVTVGLGLLVILALIVFAAGITVLMHLIDRAIVMEDLGVFDGIRRGWHLFIRRLGDVVIMGLIMFGIGLGWTLLMIPVVLLLLLAGAVVGGLPALLVGWIAGLIAGSSFAAFPALIVGVPLVLLVIIIPMLFLGGLFDTYKSSVWTLTYRELLALEAVQPVPAPTPLPPAETEVLPQ